MKILESKTYSSTKALSKAECKQLASAIVNQQDAATSDIPFYIVDLQAVQSKINEWKTYLPTVKPFFAVKCNPDPSIVKLMAANQCGFDVASKKEMEQVLKYVSDTERIVFANPCKLNSHIKYAAAKSVKKMTFDNEHELKKIKKFHPDAKVILRIATDDSESVCQFSKKFGALKTEWLNLIKTCHDLDLTLDGVSFHVGSGCRDATQYFNSIKDAREIFDMAIDFGFKLSTVDIGGGFPGFPCAADDEPSFGELATQINFALKTCFGDLAVDVIAEPGRFMVASAYTLITKITTVRQTGQENRYYINDGVYGSFNNIIYDHAQPQPELLQPKTNPQFKTCSIWGPSCDGLDQINSELYFPTLDEGDHLIWFDMGAYTSAAAAEFNGMPLPRVYYQHEIKAAQASDSRLRKTSVSEFVPKSQEIEVEC